MDLETYSAFILAATVVLVIPGPTIILVISQSASHGRRAVPALVAGVTLGDLTAMTVSLLGLGAVLAASAALFAILKLIGAAYLVYLGLRLWQSQTPPVDTLLTVTEATGRRFFMNAYVVTALNPKSIVFFVAFLPQFVGRQMPVFVQLLALGSTFLVMAAINAAVYGFFAVRLRELIRHSHIRLWINRCGGSALIGAGIFTATVRRSA